MKKQLKKTGFQLMCDIISESNFNLYGFYQFYSIEEGKAHTDQTSDYVIIYQKAGWLDDEFKPTQKFKELAKKVDALFKLAKVKKEEIIIDLNKVKEFVTLFPAIKLPTGKYARSNEGELVSAFKWFFQTHPQFDWDTILKATANYIYEYEVKDWLYMRTSQYFVRKQLTDRSWTSDLATYCNQLKNGDNSQESTHFKEKVV